MGFFNFWNRDKENERISVSVEIFEPVIGRIKASLISSDIEEGGKFLGTIIENKHQLKIKIFSYIDAGPRVSNSQTHIVPDGEHQEYLFRIIEGYDPNIEHIGSWHSHHCNGYPELSPGDIQGYKHNVNDRNFNLNWFFVMLITKVSKHGVEAKYYLFQRGSENFYELDKTDVSIVNQEYKYENILREVEQSTYSHRNQNRSELPTTDYRENNRTWENFMMDIRAEDKAWIEKNFRLYRTYRNKKDDSIYWRVNVPLSDRDNLEVTYAYPTKSDVEKHASVVVYYQSQEVLRSKIDLDENRFEKIARLIDQAQKSYYPRHRR